MDIRTGMFGSYLNGKILICGGMTPDKVYDDCIIIKRVKTAEIWSRYDHITPIIVQ